MLHERVDANEGNRESRTHGVPDVINFYRIRSNSKTRKADLAAVFFLLAGACPLESSQASPHKLPEGPKSARFCARRYGIHCFLSIDELQIS